MLNTYLERIKRAKDDNSAIIDVILDIYLAAKNNKEVNEEFRSILKHRSDSYIVAVNNKSRLTLVR